MSSLYLSPGKRPVRCCLLQSSRSRSMALVLFHFENVPKGVIEAVSQILIQRTALLTLRAN